MPKNHLTMAKTNMSLEIKSEMKIIIDGRDIFIEHINYVIYNILLLN